MILISGWFYYPAGLFSKKSNCSSKSGHIPIIRGHIKRRPLYLIIASLTPDDAGARDQGVHGALPIGVVVHQDPDPLQVDVVDVPVIDLHLGDVPVQDRIVAATGDLRAEEGVDVVNQERVAVLVEVENVADEFEIRAVDPNADFAPGWTFGHPFVSGLGVDFLDIRLALAK